MGILSSFFDNWFPLSGKVVHRSDVNFPANTVLSFRLKRESSGKYRVLLVRVMGDETEFVAMDVDELDKITEAIAETQRVARDLMKPAA